MRPRSLPTGIFAVTCGLLAYAEPARAAAATWVSGTGSDAGSCPITAPCRSFAFALSQTNANGVINVLSAGSFGPVTITKSISIVADGVEAAIFGGGAIGAGIKIQAGAGDIVSLRGLTIDLRGTSTTGISFVSGAALHVYNSVIRRTFHGIAFAPASGTSELHVADSVVAGTVGVGIFVQPTGNGLAKVVLDRVRVENSGSHGIFFTNGGAAGSIGATVRDSVAVGNGSDGILAAEFGSGTINVMIDRSAAVNNNGVGLKAANAGATINVGESTVSGNVSGALSTTTGGVINSYQTNKITGSGNPTNIMPMK